MNIDAQRVIDAYQAKLGEVTAQLVMMEALVATLQAAAETVEAPE